jgi:BTB/POZ domain-containing protein
MATISIDYDSSQGDVELILEDREDSRLDQAEDEASKLSEQTKAALYNVRVKVKEIHLRVSSLRLASSSEYFRAMLEGSQFAEGKQLKENGTVQIRLSDPEDKPEAFMIILGALYEKNAQLPTKIDFQTLQEVAVLVDKYQWHVPMTPHMISWFDSLRNSPVFPQSYSKDILIWLWIAWLFGMKDQFKSISGFAQQHACNSIDPTEEYIRLPERVVGRPFFFYLISYGPVGIATRLSV